MDYRVGWLSVTGIWGLHTFSPRALAREALSMASAGAAGSVLLRQSRGKRPSRWRVITPGARRGTDTPGRVRTLTFTVYIEGYYIRRILHKKDTT